MALILSDRVRETTTTTGTGAVTLLGAVTGYQTFLATVGNANTTYYCISGQGTSLWEVGIGTYTTSTNTLSRTTVLSSSNAGALVNLSAGTYDVFVTYPSEKAVYLDSSNNVQPSLGTATFSSITDSGLTSGRVTYAGTGGLLKDSANLTFSGTALAITGSLTTSLGSAGTLASFSDGVAQTIQIFTATGYAGFLNANNGDIVFRNYNNTSDFVRIDSGGNVLINTTTNPVSAKLKVIGIKQQNATSTGAQYSNVPVKTAFGKSSGQSTSSTVTVVVTANLPTFYYWAQGMVKIRAAGQNAYSGGYGGYDATYTFSADPGAAVAPRDWTLLGSAATNNTAITVTPAGVTANQLTITVSLADGSVPGSVPWHELWVWVEFYTPWEFASIS